MITPSVCCIMLTRDRQEYARRAVECFNAQSYAAKTLIVYSTGEDDPDIDASKECRVIIGMDNPQSTVGNLRNMANRHADSDIIIHWDDDDWSHPRRIVEQVELLQAHLVECVGYRECLFWREAAGEAWLYSVPLHWPTGSSMCYWRRVWEAKPFPDLPTATNPQGEDVQWRRGLKRYTVSAVQDEPRMICRIHGGNTADYSEVFTAPVHRDTWRRAPEWDARCEEIME